MAQPAACACGQVLFDIGDKKPDDVLTCPWCDRKYRYLGKGKVELYDGKPRPAAAEKKLDSEPKEKPAPEKESKKDKLEQEHRGKAKTEKHHPVKPPGEKTAKHEGIAPLHGEQRNSGRASVRKHAAKEDIPGGVLLMIGFIVAFNASAFIALHFLLTKLNDGSGGRLTPWGSVVPKSSIWPEIVALLAGHFVGFIAWSSYLYWKQAPAAIPGAGVEPPRPAGNEKP